jgi:nucleoside-diphosphate-sugar epimerase
VPILPSNQHPLGALPARFRRERLLIVGCGDVGLRVAQQVRGRVTLRALTSSDDRVAALRGHGLTPLLGDLDKPGCLRRLAGLATRVVYLAPPPADSWGDPRIAHVLAVLRRGIAPRALVYGSTSGVYGDCQGAWVTETRTVNPTTDRAMRRADAERRVRHWGRTRAVRSSILRIPGIYAANRAGGWPVARVQKGTPVLAAVDDVFSNHIHADDLARACVRALWAGRPQRIYHANDDTQLKMGDYFDLTADLHGLPRPPRVPRDTAGDLLPLLRLSFMSESRRMDNTRLKQELKLVLHYPTVVSGLVRAGGPPKGTARSADQSATATGSGGADPSLWGQD